MLCSAKHGAGYFSNLAFLLAEHSLLRARDKKTTIWPHLIIEAVFPCISISVIKISLSFIMGVPILVWLHFYIETGPRSIP